MWPNPQFPADLVAFTEEILNGKLNFFAVATLSPAANGDRFDSSSSRFLIPF